jgi:Cu+-exporting ATPase
VEKEIWGLIAVADPVKAGSGADCRAAPHGAEGVMITGDNRKTAEAIARLVGSAQSGLSVLPKASQPTAKLQEGGVG